MTDRIPAMGSKAALAYWATRVRASLRDARAMADQGEWALAVDLGAQAAGEAGEFDNAMRVYVDVRTDAAREAREIDARHGR